MKKIFTYTLLALFSITVMGVAPARDMAAYAQVEIAQKDKREKKSPPGPPVVRDKGRKGDEGKKQEPKKGKKQDEF